MELPSQEPPSSSSSQFQSLGSASTSTTSRANSIRKSPLLRKGTASPASKSTSSRISDDDELLAGSQLMGGMVGGELEKCSREVLISMFTRMNLDFVQSKERLNELEFEKGVELKEKVGLIKVNDSINHRVDELLNDQYRMEEELAGRIEVLDKLRSTVRESDREKRDSEKRYREQSESFDAERKAWLDQEAHYNLRISNLSSAPRKARLSDLPPSNPRITKKNSDPDLINTATSPTSAPHTPNGRSFPPSPSTNQGPSLNELMLAEQLNSLTTAHSSLTLTLRALQGELSEIKRVYQDVQEQNESYEIMLGEKTLNGEIRDSNLLKRSWTPGGNDSEGENSSVTGSNMGGGGGLESVGEDSGEEDSDEKEELASGNSEDDDKDSMNGIARRRRRKQRRSTIGNTGGGGLDLGAELEAAGMTDELVNDDIDGEGPTPKARRMSKKKHGHKKEASSVDDMKSELKSLKEANKALTLYVSKIVDRVLSLEGFEKVLAGDFLKEPTVPAPAPVPIIPTTTPKNLDVSPRTPEMGLPTLALPPTSPKKDISSSPRPLMTLRGSSSSSATSNGSNNNTTRIDSTPPNTNTPPTTSSTSKDRSRKTLSLGWDSVSSVFASALSRTATPSSAPPPSHQPAGFKPFMLNTEASTSAITSSTPSTSTATSTMMSNASNSRNKKYETDEDEEDRRERERLRAEMTLYGFSDPAWSSSSSNHVSSTLLGSPHITSESNSGTVNFRRTNSSGPTSPTTSTNPNFLQPSSLEDRQAAVVVIKSLETTEKEAKVELGQGRASGYTETKPRRSRPLSMIGSSARTIPIGNRSVPGEERGDMGGFGLGFGAGGGDIGASRISPRSSPLLGGGVGLPPTGPLSGGIEGDMGDRREGEEEGSWSKLKRASLTWVSTSTPAV